jgi:hypothetical protein
MMAPKPKLAAAISRTRRAAAVVSETSLALIVTIRAVVTALFNDHARSRKG